MALVSFSSSRAAQREFLTLGVQRVKAMLLLCLPQSTNLAVVKVSKSCGGKQIHLGIHDIRGPCLARNNQARMLGD